MRRHLTLAYQSLHESDVLRAIVSDRRAELTGWFSANIGAPAFAFGSGRAALRALLIAGGVEPGDEVIVCGFTCLAVPEAVIYAGAKPRYSDLAAGAWSSGVAEIEAVASNRTRAIIVQHTFGMTHDLEAVISLARRRGWLIIEDCALALAGAASGEGPGSRGDAAIFSLEMTKTVTSGWGGIAVVRDAALAKKMDVRFADEPSLAAPYVAREVAQVLLSTALFRPQLFPFTKYPIAALYRSGLFRMSGRPLGEALPRRWSYRLPRIHASLACLQLARLGGIAAHSRAVTAQYREWMGKRNLSDVSAPRNAATLLRFPLLVEDADRLVPYLSREGFEVGRWFDAPVAPMPEPPLRAAYEWGMCPRAEQVARHVINLPLHVRVTPADVSRLTHALDEFPVRTLPLPS